MLILKGANREDPKSNSKILGVFLVLSVLIIAAFVNTRSDDSSVSSNLLLKNATIINPRNQTVEKKDLLVEGDKIIAVQPNLKNQPDTKIINLEGKYILPGFIDTHIHPVGNAGANKEFEFLGFEGTVKRALQSGVIAILDLFSGESQNIPFRNNQDRSKGADFYTSGSCFTATKGHCTEYQVPTRTIDTPEQASESVEELIRTKSPDVIKIVYDDAFSKMPTINEATMTAAVQTASKMGVKSVIHIGTWENARKALIAGATAITHTFCKPIPTEVLNLMAKKRAYFIPTLVVQKELLGKSTTPQQWNDDLAKRVIPSNILSEFNKPDEYNASLKGFLAYQKQCSGHLLENVKKASEAGVKVLTGTDFPNPATFVGYSVHREMDLLNLSGLTHWETLRASTTYAAEFLEKNYGVEVGNIASLVILNSSPLEQIENTKDIYKVIHRGNLIDLGTVN